MNDTNEAAAQELVNKLDLLVPRDGARVQLSQYGGGPDESRVIANRRGYLRLGIEFLRAAFATPEKEHDIKADIRYLLTEDSKICFDWFERREDLPPTRQETASPLWALSISIGCVAIGVCAIIGLVTIVRWFE